MYLFLSRLIGILDVGIGHELSLERLKRRGQVGAPGKILKTLGHHESQHARPPCLSPTPGVKLMSIESVKP